jgi:FtsP/CotA-like multicopper oxidase with cupredoxin domain
MTTVLRIVRGCAALIMLGPARNPAQTVDRALSNDNRVPAGHVENDTLVVRLTIRLADWHILRDTAPAFRVLAFAEDGKPPTIPAPLIRTTVGTPTSIHVRNPLDHALIVLGLSGRGGFRDSVRIAPGGTAVVRSTPTSVGTYAYWAVTSMPPGTGQPAIAAQHNMEAPLGGAFIVDGPGERPVDRVFVITMLTDQLPRPAERDRHGIGVRQFNAVNGRAWPNSERLQYALGDSIRWRIVNVSSEAHPMHLHGFYFRVDSRGAARVDADSIYTPAQRRMVVTETVASRNTMSMTWSPDRVGGWLFHCHLTNHVVKFPPIDRPEVLQYPSTHDHGEPDQHAFTGMNGLVLGITVTGSPPRSARWRPTNRLRLFVQSDSAPGDTERRFGYVLQRTAEPARDSVQFPGPVLVLTRGQPTAIEVVNRSDEPTTVHWHGLELESYYDGVAGWSGMPGTAGRTMPAVRPGKSFEVRITPPRAGTFMYHTHFDDLRQQLGGLVGALLVLEPGERWDRERDLVFLISDGVPQRVYINGSLDPPAVPLRVGRKYRLRLADIAVFRMALNIRLVRDSTVLEWRPIAKDGFALPAAQAVLRPSIVNLPSGETADFEFLPDRPGEVVLEFRAGAQQLQSRLRFVVTSESRRTPRAFRPSKGHRGYLGASRISVSTRGLTLAEADKRF